MKKLILYFLIVLIIFLNLTPALAVTEDQVTNQYNEIQNLINEITELDNQINEYESQINQLNVEIEETSQSLLAAQEELKELKQLSAERIKAVYMYGTQGYFDYLFDSENPTDFISYYDIAKDILTSDRNAITELKKKKQEVEKLQRELVTKRDQLVNSKNQADTLRNAKTETLSVNRDLLSVLEQQLLTQEQQVISGLASVPLTNVTDDLIRSVTTQPSQQAVIQSINPSEIDTSEENDYASSAVVQPRWLNNNSTNNSLVTSDTNPYYVNIPNISGETTSVLSSEFPDTLYWPLDSSKDNSFLITSLIGNRESPGGIGSSNHGGIDIGADYGTAIIAASSGTVEIAGVYGGYGNCVAINHGNGFKTLYGHMSSLAVINGQTVQAGQIIGFVGSTGWSTGPHLHFEVRYIDNTGNESLLNGLSLYSQEIINKLRYAL